MLKRLFHRVPTVSVKEVYKIMQDPKGAAFIDVRRGDEWNTGYVEHFQHIPMSSLPIMLKQLKAYPAIYFISRSGKQSKEACRMLEDAGYTNAKIVKGGMLAWQKDGYPILRQTQGG